MNRELGLLANKIALAQVTNKDASVMFLTSQKLCPPVLLSASGRDASLSISRALHG